MAKAAFPFVNGMPCPGEEFLHNKMLLHATNLFSLYNMKAVIEQ